MLHRTAALVRNPAEALNVNRAVLRIAVLGLIGSGIGNNRLIVLAGRLLFLRGRCGRRSGFRLSLTVGQINIHLILLLHIQDRISLFLRRGVFRRGNIGDLHCGRRGFFLRGLAHILRGNIRRGGGRVRPGRLTAFAEHGHRNTDHDQQHRRHTDANTPGGEEGRRPNRAVTVYGNLIRQTFKDAPIIIGGIEASLRRLAHYDYWQDKLKRSVLLDSGADILIYGMGEHAIVEIADALDAGLPVDQITYINGTVYRTGSLDEVYDYDLLPSWDDLTADKLNYARSFNVQQQNMDPITGHRLVEPYPNSVYVVQNPPSATLTTDEMDEVAELPYARDWHPDYDAAGGVPAFAEIKFSISSNRGCFGECSFCALTFHQGRVLQMRSHDSIMREAELLTRDPEFKGYINDVGGPTANFSRPACDKQLKHGVCKNKRCLWPSVCKNMVVDESGYTQLLRDLRQLPGVKKVFVRSGIRFDYTMADASDEFLRELLEHHVSGQLRVAPEHVSDAVLSVMGKPSRAVYDAFCRKFERLNREYGLKQYVVPYLISSHPGSTMKEAVDLAEAVRDMGYMPEQVQDFYPTPSTMSTCMYYTGVDPRTMEPIYVARDPHEKAMQRALIQYRKPENYKLVREALEKAGRRDLIGYTKHCLIRPVPPRPGETSAGGGHGTGKKGGKPHGGGAGKGPKGSKGHSGMSRAQNTAGRNRAAQGRQGANGGGRRN